MQDRQAQFNMLPIRVAARKPKQPSKQQTKFNGIVERKKKQRRHSKGTWNGETQMKT